jgi:flagellar assembly protein FliH
LYKVLIRDAFRESEVRPYREADLNALPQACPGSEEAGEAKREELFSPSPEDLLAAAQEKAKEIVAQAYDQAEALRQEAYEQGMAYGREGGREEAKRELRLSLVAFAQAGQSLIVLEEQLVSRFTSQLVRLALEIAEKVVGKQVGEDPEIVASVLERARSEMPQARLVRIWLHPVDYQALEELHPDLVWQGEKGGRKVEVLTSEGVGRGGCRVETEMGVVDATVPVQMQEIRRQMLDEELQ